MKDSNPTRGMSLRELGVCENCAAVTRERDELRAAVAAYLSEMDNPVPDYTMCRHTRDRLRTALAAKEASE